MHMESNVLFVEEGDYFNRSTDERRGYAVDMQNKTAARSEGG